jgi:PAS domain S-box-containing protein
MEVYGEEVFRQDLPNYQRVLSGEPVSFESNTNDTEGREYFEIITLVPHYSGELVSGFFASIMDITERKRAEEALRGSDAKQRAMITNITDVIAIIDAQGIIRYKSENIEKIFGWTPKELVGLSFRETAHPDDVEQITTVFMKLLQEDNASTTVEYRYRHKHGSFHMIHLTAKNLVCDPTINGVLVNYHDITDRKLAEDTLLRVNQKLNILSQLTRQDLTTQIFVLKSYLDMAKKQATGQDGIIKNIESSERAIWSIKRITEFTKDYQDMGAKPPTWQNVKMALLFGLSHITIGNIQHSLETENLEIYADPLLEKVCQRLFENSVLHGGHVTRIRVWHTITPGGVTIVFEDDGIGIPQEKKEQIFLRSEGTSPSRGSLVFVREILDITGIAIKETGEPGKGARFEMVVPNGMWRFAGTRKE